MTDIRELLRDATADVVPGGPDPVNQVRRAVGRRRRNSMAIVTVVAAVVAAVVVPLTLVDRDNSAHRTEDVFHGPPPTAQVLQTWAPSDSSVASGFGSLWALACCDRTRGTSWVDRLDPHTGALITRIKVPAPTTQIAVGAGHVWTIGANPGGGGPSSISMIDPTTNTAFPALHITDPRADPYRIAFADGSAWVTMPDLDEVWRLNPSDTDGFGPPGVPDFIHLAIHIGGSPWTIAATSDGTLWVQRLDSGRLSRIDPLPEPGHIGKTVRWSSRIFGPDGANALLAMNASGDVGQLVPGELNRCDACAQSDGLSTDGAVLAAVPTQRGFFASTNQRVYYFDNAARLTGGQPAASIPAQGSSLAPDGQGVVIGTDTGLIHWVPASR
jgi:hypothetical protein